MKHADPEARRAYLRGYLVAAPDTRREQQQQQQQACEGRQKENK